MRKIKLNLNAIRRWLALFIFIVSIIAITNLVDKLPGTEISIAEIFRLQFVPALMAGSAVILLVLIIGTLIFGRIYCSLICPLGILQDLIDRINRLKIIKRNSFQNIKLKKANRGYNPALNKTRYSVLVLTVVLFLSGSSFLILMLDPYSNFGRLNASFVSPVIAVINNFLASIFNMFDNYYFVKGEYHLPGITAALFSVTVLGIIVYMVRKGGRLWCNSVCPVGTLLGLISRWSILKIRIDNSDCISCNMCVKECKCQCIDSETNRIDHSRCVTCFNCIDNCSTEAISFSYRRKKKQDG